MSKKFRLDVEVIVSRGKVNTLTFADGHERREVDTREFCGTMLRDAINAYVLNLVAHVNVVYATGKPSPRYEEAGTYFPEQDEGETNIGDSLER